MDFRQADFRLLLRLRFRRRPESPLLSPVMLVIPAKAGTLEDLPKLLTFAVKGSQGLHCKNVELQKREPSGIFHGFTSLRLNNAAFRQSAHLIEFKSHPEQKLPIFCLEFALGAPAPLQIPYLVANEKTIYHPVGGTASIHIPGKYFLDTRIVGAAHYTAIYFHRDLRYLPGKA